MMKERTLLRLDCGEVQEYRYRWTLWHWTDNNSVLRLCLAMRRAGCWHLANAAALSVINAQRSEIWRHHSILIKRSSSSSKWCSDADDDDDDDDDDYKL